VTIRSYRIVMSKVRRLSNDGMSAESGLNFNRI
jgi:hypothetical protein